MWHIIKYHTKVLLRNKSIIFWCLIFPLVLSTFIMTTIGSVGSTNYFETMKIAIIDNEAYQQDQNFQMVMDSVSSGEDALFSQQIMDEEQAKQQLVDNEIVGYIVKDVQQDIVRVNNSGLDQTILQGFMDAYTQQEYLVEDMMKQGVGLDKIGEVFKQTSTFTQGETPERANANYIYVFAILAMTGLYGGYFSLRSANHQMADQSAVGARNMLAPTHRMKQLAADFIVSIGVHLCLQVIIVVYMIVVLNISFGDNMWPVALTILTASFAGNALGYLVGMYGSKSFDSNTGILSAITLIGCALSGMMIVQLKYWVQTSLPWLAKINPGNMITDAFYANYYYGVGERFYVNILSLCIFTVVAYAFAYLRLRRKQYASL